MAKRTFKPKFLPYDEVIQAAKRRLPVIPETFFNEIPVEMRAFAFTSALIEKQSQVKAVLDSLNKALEEGTSFNDWKSSIQIDRLKKLADFRKEAIFRTHMQTAYNQGNFQVAKELKKQVPYLRYSAVLDDRTRPNHRALDGVVRPVDDPFWVNHLPPNGINCRCEIVSVGKGDELKDVGGVTRGKEYAGALKNGRPDKGWDHNKTNPGKALDNHFKRKNKLLPRTFKQLFLNKFLRKKEDTEIWWQKNKDLFDN